MDNVGFGFKRTRICGIAVAMLPRPRVVGMDTDDCGIAGADGAADGGAEGESNWDGKAAAETGVAELCAVAVDKANDHKIVIAVQRDKREVFMGLGDTAPRLIAY